MHRMPINIAVIGTGQNSRRNHLPVLQRLEREGLCNLKIVCDLNADSANKAARDFAFEECVHDADRVFPRDDIDAIYVIGTVEMHYEYMVKSLTNGKHVFVEKPPAPDFCRAKQAAALAAEQKKVAVVGLNRRFYESIREIQSLTEGKTELYSVEGVYHKPFLGETYLYGSSSWISYSGIHGIDAVCALFNSLGRPSAVYSAWNIASGKLPQNLSAILQWKNGAHAVISSNQSAGSRMESYTLHAYGVSYVATELSFSVFMQDGREETIQYKDKSKARGFYGEHREFFEAIRGEKIARHSLPNSLPVLALVDLMERGYCGVIDWDSILGNENGNKKMERESYVLAQSNNPREVQIKENPGILVLNPNTLRVVLPEISRTHALFYEDDIRKSPAETLRRVEAVITGSGGSAVTNDIMEKLPNLRVVGIVGASVKKYNPEEILRRGIPIINASDIYAEAVAEFALMQSLVGIKNASLSHDVMRRGGWGVSQETGAQKYIEALRRLFGKSSLAFLKPVARVVWMGLKLAVPTVKMQPNAQKIVSARNLKGLSVGIVGYGAIAREFIRLLHPFECEIRVFSDYISESEAARIGAKKTHLAQTLNSDIVSLHRGLSERTRHSFGRTEIAMVKSGAIFLNTARGALVDEQALVERLQRGDIFACLDVFEDEPLPKESPLRRFKNVFLTSHRGGVTKETFSNAPGAIVDKVLAYLRGERVEHLITSEEMVANMT